MEDGRGAPILDDVEIITVNPWAFEVQVSSQQGHIKCTRLAVAIIGKLRQLWFQVVITRWESESYLLIRSIKRDRIIHSY